MGGVVCWRLAVETESGEGARAAVSRPEAGCVANKAAFVPSGWEMDAAWETALGARGSAFLEPSDSCGAHRVGEEPLPTSERARAGEQVDDSLREGPSEGLDPAPTLKHCP